MFGLEWSDEVETEDNDKGIDILADAELLQEKIMWGTITNVDGSSNGVFGTPYLIEACERSLLPSVKVLLENQANPNITHLEGNSALHLLFNSLNEKSIPIIECLIQHGANLVQLNCHGCPAFALCPPKKLSLFQEILSNLYENDPEYFISSKKKFIEGIRYCLSHNLEYLKFMGRYYDGFEFDEYLRSTNIPHIFIDCVRNGNIESFEVYERRELGNVNFIDRNGWTALHHAASLGSLEMVEKLLHHKDIIVDAFVHETPLLLAALNGKKNVLERLMEAGADVSKKTVLSESGNGKHNYKEDSALHLCARGNHLDCAEVLVAADEGLLFVENHWGNIPLHIAVMKNNREMVALLLKKNPSQQVNYLNQNHESPLHYAYRYKSDSLDIVELLIANGASDDIENHKGFLPSQLSACSFAKGKGKGKGKGNYNGNNKNRNKNRNSNWNRNKKPNQSQKDKRQQKTDKNIPDEERKVEEPEEIKEEKNSSVNIDDNGHESNCVICMDNEKNCLMKPCRHIVTCMDCSSLVTECPICRKVVTKKIQVFIA